MNIRRPKQSDCISFSIVFPQDLYNSYKISPNLLTERHGIGYGVLPAFWTNPRPLKIQLRLDFLLAADHPMGTGYVKPMRPDSPAKYACGRVAVRLPYLPLN